jgi:hypothetical protein
MIPDNLIEKLKNYIPIGYSLFLFWGLLNEYLYYSLFNINISSYLELTEVLLLMYDEVLNIILFVILGLLAFAIVDFIADVLTMIASIIFKKLKGKSKPKFLPSLLSMIAWIILITTGDYEALPFLGFSIGLLTIMFYALGSSKNIIMFPISLLTLIFLIHPLNKKDKLLKDTSPHKVILKDSTLINLENPILIGETRNYVFLFQPEDSSTVGISRSDVKFIIYQK